MANYVLVNNSARLIHVPTCSGVGSTAAMIPGEVTKLEISKDDDAFFKATVKDVPGLEVFTEKKYEEYLKSKASAESALSGGLDDEPAATTAPAAPAAPATPTAWVS